MVDLDYINGPVITIETLILPDLFAVSTIIAEAGNQPLNGMIAVAEVIRERARRRYNSDGSIIGTLLHPYQFSCWNHDLNSRRLMIRSINSLALLNPIPQPNVKLAVEAWAKSKTTNLTNKAVLYHTQWISPNWTKNLKVIKTVQIGDHLFYNEVI